VWVIIDRFTKMAQFIPLKTEATIVELTCMFLQEVWRLYELLSEIVSVRDACFESKLWDSLMKLLDIVLRLSTASHPQTAGQTE
jgi:hypothetical protein